MTRIWWILIGALKSPKNLHFDMPFPVMFDLKKSSGVIFHDTREWCKILKENWLLLSKMKWGIWEIFTRALESLKIGTLMGFFCPKLKMHELKIYWEVMCHDNEECYVQKLKRNWLLSLKLTWTIWQILVQALKNLKNLHFNELPLTKVYNVWPKKVQEIYAC